MLINNCELGAKQFKVNTRKQIIFFVDPIFSFFPKLLMMEKTLRK